MSDGGLEPTDESLADYLVEFDEALETGADTPTYLAAKMPNDVRDRMAGNVECLRLLRQRWAVPSPTTAAVTNGHLQNSVGRFQVRRELGIGGNGVVFLAYDPRLRREVALKVPRVNVLANPQLGLRFEQEARAAALLDHPNIAAVYEAGQAGPISYIASAYCPGMTLSEWIKERTESVPENVATRLMVAIAEAVQHAHGRGVLHRDLKPSNIMLVPCGAEESEPPAENPDVIPKVTDFGLAKLLTVPDGSQTQTGAILGSPNYMSPEQAAGRIGDITIATDVYGLGAILYEVLTGRPPIEGDGPMQTLRFIESQEPIPPRRLRPKLSPDLETICLKCLQKRPQDRYVSAHALADDLRRFLAGEPVDARPVLRAERIIRWCGRNRVEAALLAVVAVALVSGTCVSTYFAIEANGRKEAELNAAIAGLKAREAQAAHRQSQQHLYLSKMLAAQSAWDNAELARLSEVLESVRPRYTGDDYRRFEWHYWQRALHSELLTVPCDAPMSTVQFSPDGALVAYAGESSTTYIVDSKTAKELRVLTGHSGPVRAVSFSDDSKYVATASDDSTVRIWDISTGGEKILKGHGADVTAVAFARQGMRVASASEDSTVRIWDAADGSTIQTYRNHSGPVRDVVFSQDGEYAVSSGDDGVHVWDSHTCELARTLSGHDGPVYCCDISADGERIATAAEDGSVWLWNVRNGQRITVLRGHLAGVRSIEFSPDGERLVSGGRDCVLRFWDGHTGRELFELKGHQDCVYGGTFSPDNRRIASAGHDSSVKFWDARASRQPLTYHDHSGFVDCAVFGPDSRRIASLGRDDQTLVVRDLETGRKILVRKGPWARESGIAFHPQGQLMAIPQSDHSICLYDISADKPVRTLVGHTARVRGVTFSGDGRLIASADEEGTIRLWDLSKERLGRTLARLPTMIYAFAFSPDCSWLVVTGPEDAATVFDVSTGQVRMTLDGHSGPVYGVAFSRDGSRIATGAQDMTIRLWDALNGRPLLALIGQAGLVRSVSFSPDGSRLAAGSMNGRIKLWDTATGQEVLTPLRDHQHSVHSVEFSPDGQRLLSVSGDGTVRIWDARPPDGYAAQ